VPGGGGERKKRDSILFCDFYHSGQFANTISPNS
jgi:hypothetical protein